MMEGRLLVQVFGSCCLLKVGAWVLVMELMQHLHFSPIADASVQSDYSQRHNQANMHLRSM